MLKLGIYRADQYGRSFGFGAWLRKNRVSYQLLRTSAHATPAEIARFEQLSRHILMPGGVYRMTAPNRFRELDRFIGGALEEHFRPGPLDVQDWAASDCSTSAAWYQALVQTFPQVTLTASDLNLHLTEAQLPGGDIYILNRDGDPLQYIRPPFVIRISPPEPRFLFANRWLQRRAEAKLARLRARGDLNLAGLEFNGDEELHRPPYIFRKIPMVHPAAEALRRSTAAFRVQPHSIFDLLEQPCDVLRTMNILNVTYFDRERLTLAITNVWRSLKASGIWIVGRTIEETPPLHHASILMKTGEGFKLVKRHVEKSEVEDLALALRLDP